MFTREAGGSLRYEINGGQLSPRRREVRRVELHVSVRQENGLHTADAEQTVANAAAQLVDGLRLERRVNVAVLVSHCLSVS